MMELARKREDDLVNEKDSEIEALRKELYEN
jgi:hypothetical protein